MIGSVVENLDGRSRKNQKQLENKIQELTLQNGAAEEKIAELLVNIAELNGEDPGVPFGSPGNKLYISPERCEQYKEGLQIQGLSIVSTLHKPVCYLFFSYSFWCFRLWIVIGVASGSQATQSTYSDAFRPLLAMLCLKL